MSRASDGGETGGWGFLASLRSTADAALELVQVRLELLGNELEEQKVRMTEGLFLALLGAMFLALSVMLACGFVLALFWDSSYRYWAFGVMLAAVLLVGLALVRAGGDRLRTGGAMFQASVDELRQDRETLSRRSAKAESSPPAPAQAGAASSSSGAASSSRPGEAGS